MHLIVAVGARPNVVKAAPLLPELERAGITADVAFTGSQSRQLPGEQGPPDFFGVTMPAPRWYLDVGADTHAVETGKALAAFENLFATHRPDAVMVIGDVNPSLAAAISAARAAIPVVHLGAGLRCRDLSTPEEVNRVLISRVTSLHLTPTEEALDNLLAEGVAEERLHFVGNMMAESVLRHLDEVRKVQVAVGMGLEVGGYVLCSFHRPENLGNGARMNGIAGGLAACGLAVIAPDAGTVEGAFAAHAVEVPANLWFSDTVPYRSMLALIRDAACVITDSSGVQEEACTIGTPCVTVRSCTEHTATMAAGANRLSGPDADSVADAIRAAISSSRNWASPHRWDKAVSDRIVRVLRRGVPPLN